MGKLGNGEILAVRSYHETVRGSPGRVVRREDVQGITWGANRSIRFSGGDNDTKYHITLPLGVPYRQERRGVFSAADCRKMYMVFAPRFEIVEQALDDGCFLTAGVGPGDTTWSVDNGARLTGGRYFIGDAANEERVLLLAGGATSITVQRGYESSTPGSWLAGTRMKKLPPISGFQSDVEWGATISNIAVTGDASLKVGGDSERIEESDARCKYTGFWEDYKYGAVGWPSQWWSKGHAKRTGPNDTRGRARGHDPVLCHGGARPLPRHVPEHGLRQGRRHGGRRGARRIARRSVPQRVRRHHGEREDRLGGPGRKPHRRSHRSVR